MGDSMTTPFWSRGLAIHQAGGMAAGIRRHGVVAEVLIEEAESAAAIVPAGAPGASGGLAVPQ
jgi:hypothetical protein